MYYVPKSSPCSGPSSRRPRRATAPRQAPPRSPSSDRRLSLAVTARGPGVGDDATDVTATCDRSRRDVPEPGSRAARRGAGRRDDGRSPRDDRALGDPRATATVAASTLLERGEVGVGVFGSPPRTLVRGCIRRMSGGLEDEGPSVIREAGRRTQKKCRSKRRASGPARTAKIPQSKCLPNNRKNNKATCSKGMMKMGSYNPGPRSSGTARRRRRRPTQNVTYVQ